MSKSGLNAEKDFGIGGYSWAQKMRKQSEENEMLAKYLDLRASKQSGVMTFQTREVSSKQFAANLDYLAALK